MISRISPQFTAAADYSYSLTYPTNSVAGTQRASLATVDKIPKDLWKRRFWVIVDEFTPAAGALDWSGKVVFYLSGSPCLSIPIWQGAGFNAFGWNPFLISSASANADGMTIATSAGQSTSSPSFQVVTAADKVQLELDRYSYTAAAGAQLVVLLAVLSEYPLV